MLSIFPIHFLSPLAFTFLRVVLGLTLVYLGWQHRRYCHKITTTLPICRHLPKSWFGTSLFLFEWITAAFIITGTYTQIATLAVAIMGFVFFTWPHHIKHKSIPSRLFYLLLFAAALTLTITGAGALAVDLPI